MQINKNLKKTILAKINLYSGLDYQFEDLVAENHNKENVLLFYLKNNLDNNLNLNSEELNYLIKNSDLKYLGDNGDALILAFLNNKRQNLNLTDEQIDYLIENSDLKQTDFRMQSSLLFAVNCNQQQSLNLTKNQWDYLIRNSDLKKPPVYKRSILMQMLLNKKNLSLNEQQWIYLIKNSDLTVYNEQGNDALMTALNISDDFNFNSKIMDCLIESSNLNHIENNGYNTLMVALFNNTGRDNYLNDRQWRYLINNSDLSYINQIWGNKSVLGFIIEHKPEMVEEAFKKLSKNKKFNLKNYKNDKYYEIIANLAENIKTKEKINKSLGKSDGLNKFNKMKI